jgi:hypothetical protein
MRRACIHIGLAVALVVTPALCCKSGWLAGLNRSVHAVRANAQDARVGSCCAKAPRGCCRAPVTSAPPSRPAAPQPERACCTERPPAALPEGPTTESDPRPSGAPLALAAAGLTGAPKRVASISATPSPGAGVDVRHATLYERHVLRC